MKKLCEHHLATLEAARAEDWASGLREHLESCPECFELWRVQRTLSSLAKEMPASLPSPDLIWHRFQRQQKLARAVRPIRAVEYLAAAAAVGLGVFSLGPLLWRALDPLRAVDLASQLLDAGPLLLAGSSLLLAVLVSGIYSAWAEG